VRELFDAADFVVVGTGAGGATAARTLSRAGYSVVMLEEGGAIEPDRHAPLLATMAESLRDFGAQATQSRVPMPLLQGCVVGGSTAVNSGIIWRMPDDVLTEWRSVHGLGDLLTDAGLDLAFSAIEDDLEVAPTLPEQLGGNDMAMARAAEAMGLPGQPMVRNAARCRASSRCLHGCPTGARRSMDVTYVPQAIAAGARLHTRCRVERVRTVDGRAAGVSGTLLDPVTRRPRGRLEVLARRAVILGAGAIHTPLILLRSALRGMVGERFQAHPGAAVVGRFPEPIGMGRGSTQGYEVPMRERGFKLESLALPPELLATRIPGAGRAWQERLSELDLYAQWCVQIRMRAHGRVTRGFGDRPVVRYEPLAEDLERTRTAVALLCRMMFEAGATEVYPNLGGVPEVLDDPSQVALVEHLPLRRGDFHLIASHLFGTACAGADPQRSVVGPGLESHRIRGLYVMDASVFPTNLGVNPQHSIMAVCRLAAERLANRTLLQKPVRNATAAAAGP
jgi:choline dehydrogenase-like flavoprotein